MNEETKTCGCAEGESCPHEDETQDSGLMTELRKYRGSEEIAFAFLLALTPLAVLTFFGQVGLI